MIVHWQRSRASGGGFSGTFAWLFRTATNVGGTTSASSLFGDRRRRAVVALLQMGPFGRRD